MHIKQCSPYSHPCGEAWVNSNNSSHLSSGWILQHRLPQLGISTHEAYMHMRFSRVARALNSELCWACTVLWAVAAPAATGKTRNHVLRTPAPCTPAPCQVVSITLEQPRPLWSAGQALGRRWAGAGQALGRRWAGGGQVVGRWLAGGRLDLARGAMKTVHMRAPWHVGDKKAALRATCRQQAQPRRRGTWHGLGDDPWAATCCGRLSPLS